jgi:hypothetical protein
VPWPSITVVPPEPMTIPLTASVVTPGAVVISVKNPAVGITSNGAQINSGAQTDPGPAGTAAR